MLGLFHIQDMIRDIIRDMSLTGLHVSLLAFHDAIVQRKWYLCPHFVFHGMFHEMLVQRKHTWIEKCRHRIHRLQVVVNRCSRSVAVVCVSALPIPDAVPTHRGPR